VRRMIQVLALLLVILTGSLPGLRLPGTAQAGRCCGADGCPCRMPSRTPGPNAPCGAPATTPAALPAAPCQVAQARPAQSEPSPVPPAVLALACRLTLAGPAVLARPGPAAPPGPRPDLQPLLSVFRI